MRRGCPRVPLPRDSENDYTPAAAERRRAFLSEHTGASLEHVDSFSFDPEVLSGNVEQFWRPPRAGPSTAAFTEWVRAAILPPALPSRRSLAQR
jgi:hypothetical protein